MPTKLSPKVTQAGLSASFRASNTGLDVELTHISFGTGASYDPTGEETSLVEQQTLLPIPGGSRIRPQQIRMSALWQDEEGTYPITEIGFWAGDVLFAVWSSVEVGPLATKSPGVDFVFFYDLALSALPADSITIVVDPEFNQFMTALGIHLNDQQAHPYYLRTVEFADAQKILWGGQANGTANALMLSLPSDASLTEYKGGYWFKFLARLNNTGPVTVNVAGLGEKPVYKNGYDELTANDLAAGALYEIAYDGINFQLAGGVGGSATLNRYRHSAAAGQTSFAAAYTVGNLLVMLNGRDLSPSEVGFAGDYAAEDGLTVVIPSAKQGDEVLIVAFNTFAVANVYNKAEIDTQQAAQNEQIANRYTKAETDAKISRALIPLKTSGFVSGAWNALSDAWDNYDELVVHFAAGSAGTGMKEFRTFYPQVMVSSDTPAVANYYILQTQSFQIQLQFPATNKARAYINGVGDDDFILGIYGRYKKS